MAGTKLLSLNKLQCKHCKDEITSTHVHDFKFCKCGRVAVDGGLDYTRRLFPDGRPEDHYEELSEYERE